MARHYTYISLITALAMSACSSTPHESSIYAHHQTSGGHASGQAPAYAQTVNASYNRSATSRRNQECLKQETNRELIGGAIGGTVGAFAGKELIGGTKGTVAGAALGGIAGYGIGDISTNCAAVSPSHTNAAYQSSPSYAVTPARYSPVSCPAGTAAHSSGTCLLKDPTVSAESYIASTTQTAPAVVPTTTMSRRYEPVPQTRPVTNAVALTTPTTQYSTEITTSYGVSSYQVQPGDTVYSLSRKLCVTVSDIQGSNGLNSHYGIKIGQTLQLPPNRC